MIYSLFPISLAIGSLTNIAPISSINSSSLCFLCQLYPAHGVFARPRQQETYPTPHLRVINSELTKRGWLSLKYFLWHRSHHTLSRRCTWGTLMGVLRGNPSTMGGEEQQYPMRKNASFMKKTVGYGVKRHRAHCTSSESQHTTDRNNAERYFALAKSLRLRLHRSPVSRRLALELFNESMRLRPEWKQTDSRFAVDSGIDTVFDAFACDVDIFCSRNGSENSVSAGTITVLKEGRPNNPITMTTSEAVEILRETLASIGYTARRVQERFWFAVGPWQGQRLPGPYYLRKSFDHTHNATIASLGPLRDGLDAAIRLFLLGLAIPLEEVQRSLGPRVVESARRLGILGECPVDPSLSVSLVQLFPLDAEALTSNLSAESPFGDNTNGNACTSSAPDVKNRAAEGRVLLANPSDGQISKGITSPAEMVFATDWPPPGSTALTEEPVMYIGPDSIGLVQHAPRSVVPCLGSNKFVERGEEGIDETGRARNTGRMETILDLCCGSGIQGIAAVVLRGGNARVTCVDINPRAVRFSRFNAALNGLDGTKFCAMVGDLYSAIEGEGSTQTHVTDEVSSPIFDLILANPPFVPVPPELGRARRRYDAFASGGPDGEEVVSGIFRGVMARLRPGGILAVVTELANPRNNYGAKLVHWIEESPTRSVNAATAGTSTTRGGETFREENNPFGDVSVAVGGSCSGSEPVREGIAGASQRDWDAVIFHEKRPWSRAQYSVNRAGSTIEAKGWERHLDLVGIEEMAPGFIFVRRCSTGSRPKEQRSDLHPAKAQQSPGRSFRVEGVEKLWAPYNRAALESSQLALRCLMQEL